MYCTVLPVVVSTDLGDDESSAYRRFTLKARRLGAISSSLQSLTLEMSAAYYTALSRPAPEAWSALAAQAASLVSRAHELEEFVVLDAQERDALDYFEAIVVENADLLDRR